RSAERETGTRKVGRGKREAGSGKLEAGSWKLTTAAIVVAAILGVRTSARHPGYESDDRIWRDTLEKQPSTARAHHNYAVDLFAAGRVDEAEPHARAASSLV